MDLSSSLSSVLVDQQLTKQWTNQKTCEVHSSCFTWSATLETAWQTKIALQKANRTTHTHDQKATSIISAKFIVSSGTDSDKLCKSWQLTTTKHLYTQSDATKTSRDSSYCRIMRLSSVKDSTRHRTPRDWPIAWVNCKIATTKYSSNIKLVKWQMNRFQLVQLTKLSSYPIIW